jgi:hypothetical protein
VSGSVEIDLHRNEHLKQMAGILAQIATSLDIIVQAIIQQEDE